MTTNALNLPTIGNVETSIQGKQDTIQDNGLTIAKTDGLQSALDSKFDDTGGTISGSVDITGSLTTTGNINHINDFAYFFSEANAQIFGGGTNGVQLEDFQVGSINGNFISLDPSFNSINITKAGYVKLTCNFNYENVTQNTRQTIRTRIYINDAFNNIQGEAYCYLREDDYGSHGTCAINTILQLNVDDTISFYAHCDNNEPNTGFNSFFAGNTNLLSSYINVEYLGN